MHLTAASIFLHFIGNCLKLDLQLHISVKYNKEYA